MNITGRSLAPVLLGLALALAACGGGGGGGGSPSTSNLNPGGGSNPDLQTGVFSDGPVAGLRYVQGTHTGTTNDQGEFEYDANDSSPVQFFLGNIMLGYAQGASLVTPFDLARAGAPAGLQSGYNISRLLLSLDQSPADGVQLPAGIDYAQGEVEFNVSNGVFELDDTVTALLEKFNSNDDLTDFDAVQAHLQQNDSAQNAIADFNAALTQSIDKVNIDWNANLKQAGVLARVTSANGEKLWLETGFSSSAGTGSQLWLSRILYSDKDNHYVSLNLTRNAQPGMVVKDGTVYRYMNMAQWQFRNFVDIDAYRPVQQSFLFSKNDFDARIPAGVVTNARRAAITALMLQQQQGSLENDGMLQLASHALALINNVLCAGNQSGCSRASVLANFLDAAETHSEYNSRILFDQVNLSQNDCLFFKVATANGPCGGNNTVAEANAYFANQVGGFSGPKLVAQLRSYVALNIFDRVYRRTWRSPRYLKDFYYEDLTRNLYRIDSNHYYLEAEEFVPALGAFGVNTYSTVSPTEEPESIRKVNSYQPLADRIFRKYLSASSRTLSKVKETPCLDVSYTCIVYVDYGGEPLSLKDEVQAGTAGVKVAKIFEHDPDARDYIFAADWLESDWSAPGVLLNADGYVSSLEVTISSSNGASIFFYNEGMYLDVRANQSEEFTIKIEVSGYFFE